MDITERELRQLVAEIGSLDPGFDENADLYTDLGIPSTKAMELLVALEDRYDLRVPDDEFVEAVTLDRLVTMMKKLQNG